MSAVRITVVIPYFQRDRGVLSRSIQSVFTQDLQPGVHVHAIVVDDSSPVPAAEELADLVAPPDRSLQVIRVPNGGPGAARNTALDAIEPSTDFVAFLDSDDVWSDDHLRNALVALANDRADVYFSNFFQLDQSVGAFERAGRVTPGAHPSLAEAPWIHAYDGDMRTQIVEGNIIGTSTIVYRRAAAADIRFDEQFRRAGEDYLFWLEMADRGLRFAFSEKIECTYGKGVNIFSGVKWGTAESLDRAVDEIVFRKEVLRRFQFGAQQVRHLRRSIGTLRVGYAAQFLRRLLAARVDPRSIMKHIARDPLLYVGMPWHLVKPHVHRLWNTADHASR